MTAPLGRSRRAAVLVVLAAVALTAAAALPSVPAGASNRPATPVGASATFTSYALTRPVCGRPAPGRFTCMSFRRVNVPQGTPGARRYTLPNWAHGPAGGFTPAAIATAYGINADSPTRQTVGIVDWDSSPNVRSDLRRFDRHYRLSPETAASLLVVNENGSTSPLPAPARASAVEINLDVEAVRSVCHRCKIILVEASAATLASVARAENTAVRLGAGVVSNSFGAPEHRGYSYPSGVVRAFSHRGVVTIASSGDHGWYFWDVANDGYLGPETAAFPASIPTVVSVGGTSLALRRDGSRSGESVWNSNGPDDADGLAGGQSLGATGGGCSARFAAPAWQQSLGGYRSSGCRGHRLSVDVSAVGDPMTGFDVFDSYGLRGWATIGGTSLSSPLIAGMWALSGGARGMPQPVQALYQNYLHRGGVLHDVTTGGSGWCASATTRQCAAAADELGGVNNPNDVYGTLVDCSFPRVGFVSRAPRRNPQCNAAVGYDGVSGVGTPNGLRGFRTTVPAVWFYASVPRRARRPITFTVHVAPVLRGTYVTRRAWNWGDGSGVVAAAAATSHRFARAGTYQVRVTITDNLGQRNASVRAITVS